MEQTPSKEASSDDVRKGSGEMDGQRPEGQPPEMPNGEKPDGQPPEMSNGDNPPEKPDGEKPDGPGQMGGGESGGESRVSIRLSEDAVWNVTETSLISSLSIEDDAQVVIPENVTLTVDGTEYSGCTLTSEDI